MSARLISSSGVNPSKYLLRVDEIVPPPAPTINPRPSSATLQAPGVVKPPQKPQAVLRDVVKPPLSSVSNASTAPSDEVSDSTSEQDAAREALVKRLYEEAYCPEDIRMLEVFAQILRLPQVTPEFVKPVLRSMKLLRLCDYTAEDICCIMAHAGAYFREVYALCGNDMDAREVGNVAATLLFIAHSYTQDEVCPLRVWHKHLFKKYCSMKLLNAAVFRLLRICRFKLRVSSESIESWFRRLMEAGGSPLPADWRLGDCSGPFDGAGLARAELGEAERPFPLAPGRRRSLTSTTI